MKKQINSLISLVLIIMLAGTACQKEDDISKTPTWLFPYQGVYTGVYDGDDTGTWTFTIVRSIQFEISFTSTDDNTTYTRLVTINEAGYFSFSGPEINLTGIIFDHRNVSGTWEDLTDDTKGDFLGQKQ